MNSNRDKELASWQMNIDLTSHGGFSLMIRRAWCTRIGWAISAESQFKSEF
jgi:hypothetical protein